MIDKSLDAALRDLTDGLRAAHSLVYRLCEFAWKVYPKIGPFAEITPVSMSHGPFGGLNGIVTIEHRLRSLLEERHGEREAYRYFIENWPE